MCGSDARSACSYQGSGVDSVTFTTDAPACAVACRNPRRSSPIPPDAAHAAVRTHNVIRGCPQRLVRMEMRSCGNTIVVLTVTSRRWVERPAEDGPPERMLRGRHAHIGSRWCTEAPAATSSPTSRARDITDGASASVKWNSATSPWRRSIDGADASVHNTHRVMLKSRWRGHAS